MSSSIFSVNSYTTNTTFNTCDTGDNTVQVSNKQTRKRLPFRATSPRIAEDAVYDLDGNSNGSVKIIRSGSSSAGGSTSGSSSLLRSIKKLSSSGSASGASNAGGETPAESKSNVCEIKYDLSGVKSGDELRAKMGKSLSEMENKSKGETNLQLNQQLQKPVDDSNWLGFIFCYNNDTTTADENTLASSDSGSTVSGRESPEASPAPIDLSGESGPSLGSLKGKETEKTIDLSGNGAIVKSKSRAVNRHPSMMTHATDAAILASAKKHKVVVKSSKKKKITKKSLHKKSSKAPANVQLPPPSPTRLEPGAGSLDIVMELQLDEDLLKGSRSGKKPYVFKKKNKTVKKLVTESKAKKTNNSDNVSVASERSLFSFASSQPPESPQPPKERGAFSSNFRASKTVCITGPVNGTFQNITNDKDAEHPEITGTYKKYRVFERSVDMVLNRIGTSVPLYHWTGSQSFKFGSVSMSGSGEDLSLGSFSNLDLTSPSMRSTTSGEIPRNLMNVCSEPSAKSFDVRSATYLKDGKKVPSGETMFALLGADSVMKSKAGNKYTAHDVSKAPDSYLSRINSASKYLGLKAPFLIIINFVVPWGNFISYYYRPDATNGGPFCDTRKNHASEKLWNSFLNGDKQFKNKTLKFIPKILVGPWALKKLVGTQPAMIGQKIPTEYYGSIDEGYVEICMDVTKGGKMANSICSAVASKASSVSIDLAFLLQGSENRELPEQLLSVIRLHHVSLKKKKTRIEI